MMTSIIEAIRWKAWATRDRTKRINVTTHGFVFLARLLSEYGQTELAIWTEVNSSDPVAGELSAVTGLRRTAEAEGLVPPMPAAPTYEPEEE